MIPGMNFDFIVKTGRPKGTSIQRKAIREKEFKELIDSLEVSNHLQPHMKRRHLQAFMLLFYLGLRVGELLILRVGDLRKAVYLGEAQLEGSLTKTRKPRLLQFSVHAQRELYEIFQNIIEDKSFNENYYIFHSNNPFKQLNKANFTWQMNDFIHEVLGESYSTHSFRQGLITDMLITHKLPLSTAQAYIGHSSMMTTARYAKATTEDTQKAINVVR